MRLFLSLLSISVIALACAADKQKTPKGAWAEITAMYNVKVVDGSHQQGDLQYKEHVEYRGEQEFGTIYYNPDGSVRGKTVMIYEEDKIKPVGYQYFDANDSLLVFYQYGYGEKGQHISTHAFQAGNNELLRIEAFSYDDNGNIKAKEIRNADNIAQKTFAFTYDDHGNEKSMIIDNGPAKGLQQYNYRVTKMDDDKKWLEKWGFVNDEPKTFHTRKVVIK